MIYINYRLQYNTMQWLEKYITAIYGSITSFQGWSGDLDGREYKIRQDGSVLDF